MSDKRIKQNPYSEALMEALKAVSDIANPDYLLLPIEATGEMKAAGARHADISEEEAGAVYFAMVTAWVQANGGVRSKTAGSLDGSGVSGGADL